jgi:hypothetical protein
MGLLLSSFIFGAVFQLCTAASPCWAHAKTSGGGYAVGVDPAVFFYGPGCPVRVKQKTMLSDSDVTPELYFFGCHQGVWCPHLLVLEQPWALAPGSRNELNPTSLIMDADASADWKEFHNHVERQAGKSGALGCIQDFASKAAGHAAPIAGIITIIENPGAGGINA